MTIKWPVRDSRVIPTAANSIVITVSMAGKTIAMSGPIARPPKGGTSTWSTPSLPQGTYQLAATAFPNTDGTGTAQAAGTGALTIVPNKNTQASVTMGSTVTSIATSVTTLLGRPNFTFPVTVTTKDADGNVVLVADSDIKWQISNQGVVQLASGGVHATFKGLTTGSTTVTATFTGVESTLGQSPISTPALACSVGSNSNTQAPPWQLQYATTPFGSATSSAPAASGQGSVFSVPSNFVAQLVESDGALVGFDAPFLSNSFLEVVNPDGTARWTFPQYSTDVQIPIELGQDGAIYYGQPSEIVVLNPEDGSTIATYPVNSLDNYLVAPDGSIYWTTNTHGGTASLSGSSANGTVKWTIPFLAGTLMSIGADGTLFGQVLAAQPGWISIVAIDPSNGSTKWATTPPVQLYFCHLIYSPTGKLFCVPEVQTGGPTPAPDLQCWILDSSTGKNMGIYDLPQLTYAGGSPAATTACIDSNDNLYMPGLENYGIGPWSLLKFGAGQGTIVGPLLAGTSDQQTFLSAAAGGSVLYVGTQAFASGNGSFNAYDTNGNSLWSVPYQAVPVLADSLTYSTPIIAGDGTVYLYLAPGSYLKIAGGASSSVSTRTTKR
jgi:hypothetical protein